MRPRLVKLIGNAVEPIQAMSSFITKNNSVDLAEWQNEIFSNSGSSIYTHHGNWYYSLKNKTQLDKDSQL